MSAAGTSLGSTTRVNTHHHAPLGLRLVGQEGPKSGEAPGVQAATRFPATLLDARADVRQVLHNDYSAGLYGINDVPTEHVVAILAEAVDLPGQLAEVPLGRASAFRLKRTLQSEVPAIDFTPASGAKETVVGADGWTVQANIHTEPDGRNFMSVSVTTTCSQKRPLRQIRSALSSSTACSRRR